MRTRFIDSIVQVPMRVALIGVVATVFALGCGGEAESGQGPSVSPVLDVAREQSAMVGPAGGVVQAISEDGTVYTLAIPADALVEETEISLTPIRQIDDLPMSGGLMDGVHFEPSGLELLRAATLTVELASPPALAEGEVLVGFTYDGDGQNLALAIPEVDGHIVNLPIHHFSGGGAGAATPSDLETTFAPGTSDAFIAELLAAIQADDSGTLEAILRRWYGARVEPDLQAAVANDTALERALATHARWTDALLMLGLQLSDLVSESQALAAAAFEEAVVRANDLCERQRSFAQAERALRWQRRAEGRLSNDELLEHGLDRGSVIVELCVQVEYESTSFPAAPIVGEPEPLRIVVGYAFAGGPIELEAGMVVNVLAFGALPAGTTTVTDEAGLVELSLTPEGGDLQIEIDACVGNVPGAGPLVGELVCQEAFILRGLVVSPARVTLAPGGRQQFTAERLGVKEPVTWSATGGSIDQTGRFTAGGAAGTFTVTATSIDDPSRTATARVTVEGEAEVEPSDLPTSALWHGPVVSHQANGSQFIQIGYMQTTYDPSTGRLWGRTCQVQGTGFNCLGRGVGCDALWEGTVSGNQVSLMQVNHTNGCAIGQPGQNRLYGCSLTGTMSEDPDGTVRLVGSSDGTFFSCGANVTFEVCMGGCPE